MAEPARGALDSAAALLRQKLAEAKAKSSRPPELAPLDALTTLYTAVPPPFRPPANASEAATEDEAPPAVGPDAESEARAETPGPLSGVSPESDPSYCIFCGPRPQLSHDDEEAQTPNWRVLSAAVGEPGLGPGAGGWAWRDVAAQTVCAHDCEALEVESLGLAAKLRQMSHRCGGLEDRVADKDQQVERLQAELRASEDRCSDLTAVVVARDGEIAAVQSTASRWEDRALASAAEAAHAAARADAAEATLKQREDGAASSREAEKQLAELRGRLSEIEHLADTQKKECGRLRENLGGAADRIATLETQLERSRRGQRDAEERAADANDERTKAVAQIRRMEVAAERAASEVEQLWESSGESGRRERAMRKALLACASLVGACDAGFPMPAPEGWWADSGLVAAIGQAEEHARRGAAALAERQSVECVRREAEAAAAAAQGRATEAQAAAASMAAERDAAAVRAAEAERAAEKARESATLPLQKSVFGSVLRKAVTADASVAALTAAPEDSEQPPANCGAVAAHFKAAERLLAVLSSALGGATNSAVGSVPLTPRLADRVRCMAVTLQRAREQGRRLSESRRQSGCASSSASSCGDDAGLLERRLDQERRKVRQLQAELVAVSARCRSLEPAPAQRGPAGQTPHMAELRPSLSPPRRPRPPNVDSVPAAEEGLARRR